MIGRNKAWVWGFYLEPEMILLIEVGDTKVEENELIG